MKKKDEIYEILGDHGRLLVSFYNEKKKFVREDEDDLSDIRS